MKRMQLILVAGLCLMTLASAQEPTPAPQGEGQRGQRAARGMATVQENVQMLSDKLNLTVDQVAKIRPILEDQGRQLVTVMKDGSISRNERRDKIRSIREETHAKISDLLTDDQKKKFDALPTEMPQQIRRRPSSGDENPPKPD